MFAVNTYFSQTWVSDPQKSLGAIHKVFLSTPNYNDSKDNKGIFVLDKSLLSVSISWDLGLGVMDLF